MTYHRMLQPLKTSVGPTSTLARSASRSPGFKRRKAARDIRNVCCPAVSVGMQECAGSTGEPTECNGRTQGAAHAPVSRLASPRADPHFLFRAYPARTSGFHISCGNTPQFIPQMFCRNKPTAGCAAERTGTTSERLCKILWEMFTREFRLIQQLDNFCGRPCNPASPNCTIKIPPSDK